MDGYALNDIPRSGVDNMALDQRLLEAAAAEQCVFLRVYRWSEPTLSLGYFQPYVQRLTHSHSSELPVVRRATGGGAIVHHYDWTYCIAVPEHTSIGRAKNNQSSNIGASPPLYDCMHDAVIQWLGLQGIAARKWNSDCEVDSATSAVARPQRFLCFERRSCGDVLCDEHKVMGSAQRRGPGAVLQHGSLLLARSPYAPSLQGLSPATPLTSESLLELSRSEQSLHEQSSVLHPQVSRSKFQSSETDAASHSSLLFSFFEALCLAVTAATGVDLQQVTDLEQTPCQHCRANPRRYTDPQWTHRI